MGFFSINFFPFKIKTTLCFLLIFFLIETTFFIVIFFPFLIKTTLLFSFISFLFF